jgi:uncharacterized protein (DUF362 family)
MKIIDRTVGTYHFLFDQTPNEIPTVPPKPRKINPWQKDGKALVVKINTGQDIRQSIDLALAALGPLTASIYRGDKVMVKPNYNSDDSPPASTDLEFLKALIEVLLETGARVTVGESSGGVWRPTVKVFRRRHLYELARNLGVDLIAFEDKGREWIKIPIQGEFLHYVVMPRSAYEADRLVYLPCLKTHQFARYSGALKLPFGFVHPGQRRGFHLQFLEEKLAEVNLCWQPDLIVMDGRRAFISGGPNQGKVVEPQVLLASGDLIAMDVEALKVLLSYQAQNRLLSDPWQMPQIVSALKHGLGSNKEGYILKSTN